MTARADTQRLVLDWFEANARSLPWRQTRDPYWTLVAEVMLQQTQTTRVGPIYERFLVRFPTVGSLAVAPTGDVIDAWKGLGYNRRALNLQRCARAIMDEHGGRFPRSRDALRALPGIGAYTSAAVACFAFDEQVAVIDVNVERVLGRAVLGVDHAPSRRDIVRVADEWLPVGDAYSWNQALMDISATLCRIERPRCDGCPLARACSLLGSRTRAMGAEPARTSARAGADPADVLKASGAMTLGRRPPKQSRFEGSDRQIRGRIVDLLRAAPRHSITRGAISAALQPPCDDARLTRVLLGLERDGLVVLTSAARAGGARGYVRFPL